MRCAASACLPACGRESWARPSLVRRVSEGIRTLVRMTLSIEGRATSQVLAEIGALLDSIDSAARRMSSDGERLSDLRAAVRLAGRCQALAEALAAEASAADSAGHSYGTSITTWLVGAALLTPREAGALVHSGTDLASFPVLHEATSSGSVLPQQARAITRVLGDLPTELRSSARESAEDVYKRQEDTCPPLAPGRTADGPPGTAKRPPPPETRRSRRATPAGWATKRGGSAPTKD